MGATPDVDVITDLFDVVLLNRYYGWYAAAGDLAAAEPALDAEIRAWTETHREADRLHRVRRRHVRRPAQRHADPVDGGVPGRGAGMFHRVFDRHEAVVGEQIWNFADFATAPGSCARTGTRRASSPETGGRKRRRTCCGGAGGGRRDRSRRRAGDARSAPVPRLRGGRGRQQPHVPNGLGVRADLLHRRRRHLRRHGGHAAPRRSLLGRLHRPARRPHRRPDVNALGEVPPIPALRIGAVARAPRCGLLDPEPG